MLNELREDLQRAETNLGDLNDRLDLLLGRFPKATNRKALPGPVMELLEDIRLAHKQLQDLRTRYAEHCAASSW